MTPILVRQIFSQTTLARLAYDVAEITHDADTNIELHYRFEHAIGGRLRLTGGLMRDEMLSVGCDPDDINKTATIMLAGLKARLA